MGRYIGQSDVETVFGAINIARWSNLDNLDESQSPDVARIAEAIANAEDRLDDELRDSRYAVPVTGTIPRTIKFIVARWAGAWLYQARGIEDRDSFGRVVNPIGEHGREADQMLMRIQSGQIRINAPTQETGPSAPTFA